MGQCSVEVNIESHLILFEYMLKYNDFIGISNLFVVDIDAINNKHSFLNKISIAMEIQQKLSNINI